MAYPLPFAPCDACDQRRLVTAASFTRLRGHGSEPGLFCLDCRELLGEVAEDAPER